MVIHCICAYLCATFQSLNTQNSDANKKVYSKIKSPSPHLSPKLPSPPQVNSAGWVSHTDRLRSASKKTVYHVIAKEAFMNQIKSVKVVHCHLANKLVQQLMNKTFSERLGVPPIAPGLGLLRSKCIVLRNTGVDSNSEQATMKWALPVGKTITSYLWWLF